MLFRSITAWMRKKHPEINQLFLEPQPTLTPHRLDTGTSGVLIVALSPVSFKSWRERFKNKEITKTYLAWCWGAPENDEYVVDYSIAHAIGDSQRMVVVKGESGHRPPVLDALSYVKVVKRLPEHSLFLAQVVCRTGVTHQVRVHLASLGFPLLGDKLYDTDYTRRTLTRDYHALRAVRLDFHEGNFSVSDQEFRHEF